MNRIQRLGLIAGPTAFAVLLLISPSEELTPAMLKVAATGALMAIWWMTEAIPIPATSLLPIVLFPALGVMTSKQATLPYANHLIYLFIGGFFIALAMEKWHLHRRLALHTIRFVGTSPQRVILGFMLASALLSMWVSNTATTMMMLPVGLAVISQVRGGPEAQNAAAPEQRSNFGTALMLGIAYAASIGGIGTIIGSPPNTFLAGYIEQQFHRQISFASWMIFAVPVACLSLGIAYLLLVKLIFPPRIRTIPGGREFIDKELAGLGTMSKEEKLVILVFAAVATAWIARGFLKTAYVADATIAIAGALLLFLIPSDFAAGKFLLDWRSAAKLPWGIIVLFGGGLALTNGVNKAGLNKYLAVKIATFGAIPHILLILIIVLIAIFLTELTSNTATATILIPIMGSLALTIGQNPYALMLPACLATSYAFMLPVATPPNAIVFSSDYVTIRQMAKTGFWLNILSAVVITLFAYVVLPLIFTGGI